MKTNRTIAIAACALASAFALLAPAWADGIEGGVRVFRAGEAGHAEATVSLEKGVRVVRGPALSPDRLEAAAPIETALEGAARPRAQPAPARIVFRNCYFPNRLTTHGFGAVRRYNRALGPYPVDTFGFNAYRRNGRVACRG